MSSAGVRGSSNNDQLCNLLDKLLQSQQEQQATIIQLRQALCSQHAQPVAEPQQQRAYQVELIVLPRREQLDEQISIQTLHRQDLIARHQSVDQIDQAIHEVSQQREYCEDESTILRVPNQFLLLFLPYLGIKIPSSQEVDLLLQLMHLSIS